MNDGFKIHCYPNPFAQDLKIEIELTKSTHLTIELWNLQGKKMIIFCKNQFYTVGNHLIRYDTNRDLPKGMYFLSIQDENGKINYVKLMNT